jgi:propionyl-CoA carboxylase alpha chain
MVTGVDLVEQMIRVAAGHKLPDSITKTDWSLPKNHKGWSLESRVYAEDPFRGFLPSTGRLITYKEPRDENGDPIPGVRIDTGISEGSDISMHYDPMICKLITHGATRNEAIDTMNKALDSYVIRGPGHNISFLRELCRHPRFISGNITTKFIPEEYPKGFLGVKLSTHETNKLLALVAVIHQEANMQRLTIETPFGENAAPQNSKFVVSVNGVGVDNRPQVVAFTHGANDFDEEEGRGTEDVMVMLEPTCEEPHAGEDKDGVKRAAAGGGVTVNRDFDPTPGCGLLRIEVDGELEAIQILEYLPEGYRVMYCGGLFDVTVRSEKEHKYSKFMLPKAKLDTSSMVLCPMPGLLVSVAVKPGDTVQPGQELCIVEAMKMQNVLRATKKGIVPDLLRKIIRCDLSDFSNFFFYAGVIKSVLAGAGATLKVDAVIIEFEPEE